MKKSTVEEIRQRFDGDVERFSNLETGQSATLDAPLALQLIAEAAAACTPHARHIWDIGCGAGNFTLRLLRELPVSRVSLLDLSRPMLDRAAERINTAYSVEISLTQGDIRETPPPEPGVDIILAGAVLHHLRTDAEWDAVFRKLYAALNPGGSCWIFDLVTSGIPAAESVLWKRYGEYLAALKGEDYRDHVFAYIEQEDTPRPLMEQLNLLQRVGFAQVETLHRHACFAAFGAVKAG